MIASTTLIMQRNGAGRKQKRPTFKLLLLIIKKPFAEAEEACPSDWCMVLKNVHPVLVSLYIVMLIDRWFDPNDIVNNEECMGRSSGSNLLLWALSK
jgi:hypothetical protein